uniref:Uncharacterized protein n=1 Tax=Oryza sativa subsp. japonica TaxID=39947 RepID=Q6YTZ1_ORYSJ|nr:hypothetical protein [Oryza sativa Japonica Group]BAD17736.1 hypothetical protein [Oryza sativa Japonica Group]
MRRDRSFLKMFLLTRAPRFVVLGEDWAKKKLEIFTVGVRFRSIPGGLVALSFVMHPALPLQLYLSQMMVAMRMSLVLKAIL